MTTYATDKVRLGYLDTYLDIAETLGSAAKVCELGVFQGDSLRMWLDLFPDGLVVGVDKEETAVWPDGTVKIVCGQDSPFLPGAIGKFAAAYDLIVDDASHRGALTERSFELLWPQVAAGGFYVIEDWQVAFWPKWGDDSMLRAVSKLLLLLDRPDGEAESVTYRHGMAVVRKR